MDAASGFILGTAFVSATAAELSVFEARRLFKSGWAHNNQHPATLFIPKGQLQTTLAAEATRRGVTVAHVQVSELLAVTGEAKQGFRMHVQGGAA